MFLTIGSFAVITVMSHEGDTGHQITDYRGLARRQPVLALSFAVLLLGQAGVPFTTGFLAKFGVVGASVATHAYALAVDRHGVGGRRRLLLPAGGGDHVLAGGRGRPTRSAPMLPSPRAPRVPGGAERPPTWSRAVARPPTDPTASR